MPLQTPFLTHGSPSVKGALVFFRSLNGLMDSATVLIQKSSGARRQCRPSSLRGRAPGPPALSLCRSHLWALRTGCWQGVEWLVCRGSRERVRLTLLKKWPFGSLWSWNRWSGGWPGRTPPLTPLCCPYRTDILTQPATVGGRRAGSYPCMSDRQNKQFMGRQAGIRTTKASNCRPSFYFSTTCQLVHSRTRSASFSMEKTSQIYRGP